LWFLELLRRNDNETEFDLYRHGSAYLNGIPGRIFTWKTALVFKIKRQRCSGELIAKRFKNTKKNRICARNLEQASGALAQSWQKNDQIEIVI
jgi:hypothetical protein